jgi:phospholipid transport system substrate-binding protein
MRILLILLLVLSSAGAWAAAPADVVNSFHDALIDSMKRGPSLGCDGRSKLLKPVIESSFDLPYISQLVMRRHWDEISDEQKARFQAVFKAMVVATYASQFKSWDQESFTVVETRDAPGGNKLVRAKFDTGDPQPVSFDYYLRPSGDSWKIVNVVADGVSDLALRSTQYDQQFREHGFDGLLNGIEDQKNKTLAICS